MGGDPTDGPPHGQFPPPVGKKDSGDTTMDTDGWDMGMSPAGRWPSGVRSGYNGDLNL